MATIQDHPTSTDHEEHLPDMPTAGRLRLWQMAIMAIVLVGVVSGLYAVGQGPRHEAKSALAHEVEERKTKVPSVRVIEPKPSSADIELTLPGDIEPIEQTVIYPRTSGYLKKWYVDIGQKVEHGQLLAEIDTPEIDQQYKQAVAKVEQYKARLLVSETRSELAQITLARVERLINSNASSQQEFEQRRAEFDVAQHEINVAKADIAAGEADLQRIVDLQSFAKIYAPFDGTITQRSIDLGQLVTSGNDQAQSLFRLVRTDRVRVIVNVPQIYAPNIHKGQAAHLIVREMPTHKFEGLIARSALSLDSQTRTMRTEIEVDNQDGLLLPGTYVQVSLQAHRTQSPLIIPASALIVNADGTHVAAVNAENLVELREVDVEGDYGTSIGVISGINATDRVVINPGDRLTNGMQVGIVN